MANVYEQGQEYTKGLFDAALDKQTQLQQARDNKLAALTNSKPITIAGYDDADTIKSTDNTTYRLQAADGTMYDSIESKHGTKPIDMQGGTGAYQKSPAAMTKQRQLVSSMVGKPESALTEQDFVDVSNWQLVQAMADQANGAGKWEAPFGTGTAPLNMSGKFKDANGQWQEAPLDIPATVKTMGKDKVGRTLGVLGTADGFDATTTAAHDPKRNIYSNTAPVTPSEAEANKQKAYDALAGAYGTKVTSQIANAGKAFVYRAAEGIAQTLDLVPEVVEYGYKNLTKNPNANWSDMEGLFSDTTSAKLKNFLGYDDHRMQALAEEAKTAVTNAYDKGDYWGVLKALGHAVLTPEVTGESMGFLASMILPGTGALKALRVSSGVTKGVKAAVAAEEAAAVEAGIAITAAERTAMTAKALKEAEESAGVGYTLAKVVAENPGYINYAEQVARDSEKEYKEKYGTEMDGTRRTGAFLLGLASGKLDAAMGTALIKGTDPLAKLIRAAWVEAPEAVQKSIAIAIVKATGMPMARVVGAMAEEGFTEGLQTALENTAAKYNSTAKGGSLGEIFTDKDNLTDIGRDALIGAAGGAQFAGPSITKDVASKAAGKMVDGVQKVADKMASNKPEAVAARAQAEEVTVAQQASKTMFDKVNLMTPDQKAKFVVSLDALAVADDSPESIEIKNIATDVLQGKDDKGILGADIDDAEAGRRITNAIMSADGSIIANIDNVVENVQKLRPNMDNVQVVDIVGNAFVVRQAMDTLQSMKTTDEVGKEVAEGDRGFNTYFRNIMQARAVGDVAAAEEYTTKLETFQAKQESKIRTIQGLVSTMEQQLHSAAQAAVDASGGDISYAAGLKAATERLGEQSRVKSRGKVGKVSYGTGVFEMSYRTVAERMQMDESAQATFNGGGFSGLNNMIRELDAMNVISAEVHGTRVATQKTAPTAQPAAPLKDRIKAWVDKQLAAEGATIETVKAKVDGLAEDKAESKQLANDYISELLLDNTIEEPNDSKIATKKSFEVKARVLTRPEIIETVIDGKVETTKKGEIGDYVLTGPKGEEYTVDAKKVKDRYTEKVNSDGTIVLQTKPVDIKYSVADKDFTFTASWGEQMIAEVGDALVYENGKLSYRIEKEIFKDTYATVEEPAAKAQVDTAVDNADIAEEPINSTPAKQHDLSRLPKSDREFVQKYMAGELVYTAARTTRLERLLDKAAQPKEVKPRKTNAQVQRLRESAKSMQTDEDQAAIDIKRIMTVQHNEIDDAKTLSAQDIAELTALHEEELKRQEELKYEDNPMEEFDWSTASEEILEDMNADLYDGSVEEVGEVEIPTDNVYDMLYTGDEGMSLEYDENEYSALMFGDNVEHNAEVKQLVRDQSTIEDELDTALANEASEEVVSEIQGRLKALREKLKEYRQYADKLVSEISKRYGGKFFTIQGLKNIVEGKTVQDQLLKASNVTKLAASEVAILPEAQKLVTQALKHLGLNVSENGTVTDPTASSLVSSKGLLLASNKIVQNPALALLIKPVKVDGVYKAVVDSNVANAMYAAQMSYLADNVGEFTMGKTDDEMFEMFAGFKAYDPINPDAVFVDIQRYGGMFAKFAAADAGAEVMTYLGLKAGAMSIPELHQGFVAGFGAMLVNGMIDDGLLKVVKVDNALVLMAAKNDENKVALFDAKVEIVKEARRFENEYLVDANKGRGPSMAPQSADRRVTIHHQPYANATDIQTEAIHTLEQMGMQVNEGYDVLMDVFGDEATLLREVGVEEINEETQTFDTRESLEASNRAHTDAVGYLKSAYEKFKDALMYFKWFVTKGGRFNLDSTEVNPQTNKQLHRWLVTAADAMTTMKTADVIALANYEEGQKLPELAVAFAYGLAQGFGVDVEKETEYTVLMEAKRLVNMTKAELIVHARDKMSTAKAAGKRAFAHPGQLAVAIAAVDRFRTAENGEFTTSLTVEFDGLTNGFSFKIMQYPLNDYKMWLPKIGVLLEGSQYYHHESMNSVKADKGNKLQDTYETIGSVMVPRLFTKESKAQDIKVAMVWTRPKGLTDTPRATEQQVITAAELSDKLISNEIAPDMKIVNGVVSSTVRNIMKNPTMIFNYAAGITKIIDNVTTNMVTDTIDKVYQLAQNDPAKFTEIFGIEDAQGVALALKTEPLSSKSNAMIRTKLYDAYKIMYGIPVGEALESKFKSYIKLNKALNEAFSFMYSVFKKNVPDVATELYKAGRLESHYGSEKLVKGLTLDALSTADAIIVIREMVARGMAPAVASPDTNTRMQQLVVFDRAVADIKKAATTKDDLEAPRNARVMMDSNGKEDTYLSLFTRVVGEPGAAGGVLMTHTKDGLAIGKTIIEHPHLGVHDASVWGLHQMMEGTRSYNKNWYAINKMFSDVDAVLDALTRTMKFDKVVNGTKLDASDTIATLKRYQQTISKNRVELYTTNAKIGQQVGTNGSMYEVDANKQRAEALKEVVSALAEVSAGLSRQGQAAVKAAVNKYKDSPIALINNVLDIVGKNTVEYDKLARLKDRVKTMIATTTTARDTAVETEQDVETYTQPAVTPKVPTTPKPAYAENTAAAELAAKLTKVNAKAASTMIDDSKDC